MGKMMIYSNDKLLFSRTELACQHCGMLILSPGVDEKLARLRITLDEPMGLSSACRCSEHNKAERGHSRSLHVCDTPFHPTGGCCAFDVDSRGAAYNARLIKIALELGWSCGVHRSFIHIDRRVDFGMDQGVFPY